MCTMTATTPPPPGPDFPVALSQPSKKATEPQLEDRDQAIVYTPYGRGLVVRTRKSDGIKEVQLLEWESFAKPSASVSSKRKQQPYMMYTAVDYPSVIPHVGDDVVCAYGRGRVTEISRILDSNGKPTQKYTVVLSSWRLGRRSTVTCHVTSPPPRVVRKHTLSEMDANEKVALAADQKAKATTYFSQKKDYSLALATYASAVDAVRNVQHDYSSTNEVRADLIVVMVTCSNNAATCCAKLQKWEEASKFAKNALILLDALYGKRGKKIHSVLNREGAIDAKMFGEWRVKSYLVVARSSIERGDISDAMGVLKKARTVAMGYIDELNTKKQTCSKEEKASLKSLTSQVKEIRKLLVECSDKKKATKKMEQRRAKAMFGGDKENASPAQSNKKRDGQQQQRSTPEDVKANGNIAHTKTAPLNNDQTKSDVGNEVNTTPLKRKSSLNTNKKDGSPRPTPQKSVSFSQLPPQVKEFEKTGEDENAPWYSEHKEALIMLAVAGFSAAALMAMRKASR